MSLGLFGRVIIMSLGTSLNEGHQRLVRGAKANLFTTLLGASQYQVMFSAASKVRISAAHKIANAVINILQGPIALVKFVFIRRENLRAFPYCLFPRPTAQPLELHKGNGGAQSFSGPPSRSNSHSSGDVAGASLNVNECLSRELTVHDSIEQQSKNQSNV
ncbi:unnamed protein product [Leptosia nina]